MTSDAGSAVNIGDVGRDISNSIIAGRDVIQNIIVVGQFLDFAKVQDLLPASTPLPDLASVSTNLDQALQEHLGSGLAVATAAAGEILRDILAKWRPNNPGAAFPFRQMLPELAPQLVQKLKTLNYWDTFSESGFSAAYSQPYQVIWLEALTHLWLKRTGHKKRFGLAEIGPAAAFVTDPELEYADIKKVHLPEEPRLGEFAKMSNEQFRIFMAGLVIDLIRLASEAAADVEFWQGLGELFNPKSK
ncbi:MAG: hypothetical protein DPW09_43350 [Anaerolineae bacterium]|nr:hypothetical protein [Anaerolineales bacterium]MCQ3980297.1 hypothetical protein [Anaerolineae bacterium]